MTVQNPPAALQNASHNAALFREAWSAPFVSGGVLSAGELAVSAQGTPNMSVVVSAGRAMVPGTSVSPPSGFTFTAQGMYYALNDGSVTVTIAAADATNPRIDTVYAQIQDSFYSGTTNQAILGVATGIPAPSPFAPVVPSNAIPLANVAVAANATSITSGNISQVSSRANTVGGTLPVDTLANLNLLSGSSGQHAYVYNDSVRNGDYVSNGSTWGSARPAFQSSSTRATTDSYPTGPTTLNIATTISNAPKGTYHLTGRVILKSTQANAGTITYLVNGVGVDSASLDVGTVVTHVPVDLVIIHPGGNLTADISDNRTAGTATVYAGSRLTLVFIGV